MKVYVCTAAILLACACVPTGYSQVPGQTAPSSTYSGYVVDVVDGAKTPDNIPDVVAYAHFFGVLAKAPGQPDAAVQARRTSYLKFFFRRSCGVDLKQNRTLSDDQVAKLLRVVDELTPRLEAVDKQIAMSKADAESPALSALRATRDRLVTDAVAALPMQVDGDAADKIRGHVTEHVKAHISIAKVQLMPK